MGPAQAPPGFGEERKPEITVKPEPEETREAGGVVCANSREDNGPRSEALRDAKKVVEDAVDEEIDVLGDGDAGVDLARDGDPDGTECSSSFGHSFLGSDYEDVSKPELSDVEVDSEFCVKNEEDSDVSDGQKRLFKKKKVTNHWRNFIRPVMWRCQWLELRMKELQSQALKYGNELAKYKHEKQLQSTMVDLDSSASRLVPFTSRSQRKQAMKRRRKRRDNTIDISSYFSHHNIFSYYENTRPESDIHSVDGDDCDIDDQADLDIDDLGSVKQWLFLGRKDNALEKILLDIDALQSRILKVKTNLNKVMCRNSMETSLPQSFIVSGDRPVSHARSRSCSPECDGDAMPAGARNSSPQHVLEVEMEDALRHESPVSSSGEAVAMDIFGSALGFLTAVPSDQHQDTDDILINNEAAEKELQNFEVSHGLEKPHVLVKEEAESSSFEEESSKAKALGPEPRRGKMVKTAPQPVLKPCYTGKRRGRKPKRKRRGGFVGGSKSKKQKSA